MSEVNRCYVSFHKRRIFKDTFLLILIVVQVARYFNRKTHFLIVDKSREMMENPAANDALINQLPDECLGHIFTFLPISERLKIEQVCKRWCIISERGWNDIKKLSIDDKYSDDVIQLILKRCGFLKELSIRQSTKHSNYLAMVKEFSRLDQLEKFSIAGIDDDDETVELNTRHLKEIFRKTQELVTVHIHSACILNRIDYLYLLNPRTLRELILGNFNESLSPINVDRFPNLEKLILMHFTIIGDEKERDEESLKKLDKMCFLLCNISRNIIQRIETFKNLKTLSLGPNYCVITNEDIRSITTHCHQLKQITLSRSPSLTMECFQYLGVMPSLQDLKLQYFDGVNMACLTNVKILCMNSCIGIFESDGLIDLITNSSRLETLKLYHIHTLNTTFLNNVSQIFHRGQRVKPLRLELKVDSDDEFLDVQWEKFHHPLLDFQMIKEKIQRGGELGGDE